MAQIPVTLQAGQAKPVEVAGAYFTLMDIGAAGTLEVTVFDQNQELERITTATRGLTIDGAQRFTKVMLKAANDCIVQIVISDGRVRVSTADGANVNATIVNAPLPVVNDRGAPANPVYVSGITYSDAPATSATSAAPVAVTSAGAVVAAADAACKSLRLCNLGPDPVAIGPAGQTWANRSVVLQVDDVWVEDRGANLAWSAITEAGKTASVTVQRIEA